MILCQKIIFFPIAEGGVNIFGVFRVKNHNFMPKNQFFPNFRGGPPWIRSWNMVISKQAKYCAIPTQNVGEDAHTNFLIQTDVIYNSSCGNKQASKV